MIGIDRKTGKAIFAWPQLLSRISDVMTTPVGARVKQPKYGSNVRNFLDKNTSDELLIQIQSAAISAFYEPVNGISDFEPTACVAKRHDSGVKLFLRGYWQGQYVTGEIEL